MDHPDAGVMREAVEYGLANHTVGATVVRRGEVLLTTGGTVFDAPDATGHSEVEAIRAACARVDSPTLDECWLYTTHEPCPMCMGALCWANLEGVVYAVGHDEMPEEWGDQAFTVPATHVADVANDSPEIHGGVCRTEALRIPDH